jgi:hypothetical protein
MATRKQQRGYAKVSELRKKLRETPDLVEKHVRPALENAAQAVKADMIQLTPDFTGDAKAAMAYSISRDGMAALVGVYADKINVQRRYKRVYGKLGVSSTGKIASVAVQEKIKAIGDVFYFRFLDRGTKGFSGTYTKKNGTKVTANIPPMPALNIRERALDANSNYGKKELANAINRALKEAATRGSGVDG